MEGKLDAVLSEMRGELRQTGQRLDEHDGRLTKLETVESERHGALLLARWLWGFITAAIGVLGGVLGGGLLHR